MINKEILYKNEKLTKRLLELKSEKHKLTIRDKFKLNLLKKYNISNSESKIIDDLLLKENHIRFAKVGTWTNESGDHYPTRDNPYITEHGLNALKHNYYDVSHIRNKLKTPQAIFNIISTILIITTSSIAVVSYCSSNKIGAKFDKQKVIIDSLKIKTNKIEAIVKKIIKNNTKDTLYTKSKDILSMKSPKLIRTQINKIDSINIKKNKSSKIKN